MNKGSLTKIGNRLEKKPEKRIEFIFFNRKQHKSAIGINNIFPLQMSVTAQASPYLLKTDGAR